MIKIKSCPTYWAKIFIAGPLDEIEQTCRNFCTRGFCVTVTPTNYIYTYGEESGVEIGVINYPRFPKEPEEIVDIATDLGFALMEDCCQGSFSIMTPDETTFYSRKKEE